MDAALLTTLLFGCEDLSRLDRYVRGLSGSYRDREASMKGLRAYGERARGVLGRAGQSEDLEVQSRVRQLLFEIDNREEWKRIEFRIRQRVIIDREFPCMPCIDFAWQTEHRRGHGGVPGCLQWSREEPKLYLWNWPGDRTPEGWWSYRAATRRVCYAMADSGVPIWVIAIWLTELQRREAKFLADRRKL